MDRLDHIRIVLDHTSHPGNIGAAARAMKVMGLTSLHLVQPERFPDARATALASSADDLLDRASVDASLGRALEGCTLVLGTSARSRRVSQPVIEPREAAERALAENGSAAIVFGCEKSGLDNDALDRCHALVSIPTGTRYASLNLAQAVQVVTYELHLAARAGRGARGRDSERVPASADRMEVFFVRLERTLAAIRFSTPGQDQTLHRRLRRLFLRARPDYDELNMLNGILSSTLKLAGVDEREQDPESGPESDR